MSTRIKSKAQSKWQPAPEKLVHLFEVAVQSVPQAQARKMFGYPVSFINGNMFAGLFEDKLFLRLSEDDRASLLRHRGTAPFEPMPGRPMREYVVVSSTILKSKTQLNTWLGKAFAYAQSLPPRSKSKRKE